MRLLLFVTLLIFPWFVQAQNESDTLTVNQDAIYNRPFITVGQSRTALGGYVEGNTNYFSEDGISEGFSMELRRFNIFMFSQMGSRIRFLSELEFEHGTEEIAIETAILDFKINSGLNFRAGILLPAIGIFNTNHDSPNWEFVNRPISSTGIIPTTLSEVGFGFHGKFYPNDDLVITYDLYATNGLQDGVILNSDGRTSLEGGKSEEMFAEDNNGTPMVNARLSVGSRRVGEFGVAYYGGVYNTFRLDGAEIDKKRSLHAMSLDFNTTVGKLDIKGEGVMVSIDVPDDIDEIYGESQIGGFVDFIYPVLKKPILKFENAVLNVSARVEYADLNAGEFTTNITGPIGDEDFGLALGVGLRPRPGTLIRFNYRRNWVTDQLGNPPAQIGGIQFGVASYF